MAPIRVGIIGLSASGTSGTSWAEKAHLDYLRASPKYTVTAVCNSSVASAEKAIKTFELGADAKAYGNPEDIANDPNVDLVVVVTRVDKHAGGIVPALRAGKDVFCEWPLVRNVAEAEEVAKLAREKRVRTMVGLQGHVAPVVNKVKELVEHGKIGNVLSTTWIGSPSNGGAVEGKGVFYFTDREVGGNPLTIHFGHSIDYVLYALGEFESFNSLLAQQRKSVTIIDRATNEVVEKDRPKNTFDQMIVQGRLQSNSDPKPVLSYHMRGGDAFPSDPKLIWRVYGSTGEIQVTASGPSLSVGYPDTELKLFDAESEKVEEVELEKSDFFDSLPLLGRNIGRLYEAFADGKGGYPDFEHALKRHRLLDEMERRADGGSQLLGAEYLKAKV
ncbi:NAD-P-binding protein [Rhizodiscina lignyota]|uniref:NAD-P-binding protein n=1 Tax=Rhizodiscina lignyota TaxID=1504668 RepID=A0A9P4IHH9_9PEZI|nr:NAD-P-binding protein [Rhizodiscina lignyota]